MDWDDWNKSGLSNSAQGMMYLEKKKKEKEAKGQAIKEREEYDKWYKEELRHKENLELQKQLEEQKLRFEKNKEKNNWRRSFVTWTLSSIAILVSITALIISLVK